MILQEISKRLRILTQQNIEEPKKEKNLLLENQQAQTKAAQNEPKDQIDERNRKFKEEIEKINLEIYKKSISLEYFWRCLVFYLGIDTDYADWKSLSVKNDVVQKIENLLKNGDCFELIDGENLEFKGLFIQEVIKRQQTDKVIVVCVIGPQSTGKSTLMNYAFGTQFFTSAGRCTKGIYFTLQKITDTSSQNQISWLLMLDTEGLQSPERIDDEYDRKIVLFAMLSADVLIINSKGEINANMINTLKMCCVTYDALQKYGYNPEIIYINGQNDQTSNKQPFKDQVVDLKSKVIEASDSNTIEKVAEQLLGYNDDKMHVFGYAYQNEYIEKDDDKEIDDNYNFKISNTNFGVETAQIYNIVQKVMNDKSRGFKEINMWLEESKENWNVIDRFSASINQFSNLEEFRNDKKVQKYLNEKWMEYLSNNSIIEKDEAKCNLKKQELIDDFQKHGQDSLEKEIRKVVLENDKEKDDQLENEIFKHYDEWKQLPLQKGITVFSEKNHKNNIIAKMDVIKNEFNIKLRAKIKEEQMLIINQNGHRKVLNRAYQLSHEEQFKNEKDEIKKEKEAEDAFEKAWEQSIDEIIGKAQLNQMKKSYFDDLQRTFQMFNKFIEHQSEQEYQELLEKVEEIYKKNDVTKGMEDFLIKKIFTNINVNQNHKQLFGFNQDVFLQMIENPKDRLFDKVKNPENYLKLTEMLSCDYTYMISKDLGEDLQKGKQLLKKEMYKNLTTYIEKLKQQTRINCYGELYNENKIIQIDDEIGHRSYLQLLFQDFQKAGFVLKITTDQNEIKYEKLWEQDVKKIYDSFNEGFDKNYKKKQWVDRFVDNLHFDKKNISFQTLEKRIAIYFNSTIVKIQNQIDPNIPLEIHKNNNKNQGLDKALIVSDPFIQYKSSSKYVNTYHKPVFDILIAPRNSPQDSVLKWQFLSKVAHDQMDWRKIVQEIRESVKQVLTTQTNKTQNLNITLQEERKEGTQEINFNKIMQLNQMDYNQISNLEAEYLTTNLREKVNQELYSKLGLFLSHISDAKISQCALIYSWVELYKKAEETFNSQLKQLQDQKTRYWNEFQEIVSGNIDKLTSQSSTTLMSELERKYIENVKQEASLIVAKKIAELKSVFKQKTSQTEADKQVEEKKVIDKKDSQIAQDKEAESKSVFDTYQVYKFLDNKYLNPPENFNYDNYLLYVQNPVKIFEDYVEDLKNKKIINGIIIPQSEVVYNEIQDNMSTLLNILKKLNEALNNFKVFENNNKVENYFYIKKQNNNQILDYQQQLQLQLSKHIFPVINYVIRKLLKGEFTMNEFEFKIIDDKKSENYYIFQPKKICEQGPLEIFIQTQQDIKQIINNQKNSNQLVNLLIKILQLNQYDNNCRMFQINIIIQEMLRKAEEMKKNFEIKSRFDEAWFGCQGSIKTLIDAAIGCKSLCQFCGRKCELTQHQLDTEHSCDNMGHQMRIFKDGFLLNDKGEMYPSLKTCDMIKPDSKIYIDDIPHTWQDLLEKQAVKWRVIYKANNKDFIQKYESFMKFWSLIGEKYCEKKQFLFIKNSDEIDKKPIMDESAVIAICIDMSGSMSGHRWDNAVKGAKQLIDYIKNHHSNLQNVQLIIILFDDNSKVVHDDNLQNDIPEKIWEPNYEGTNFGKPLKHAIKQISLYIENKNQAKIYFFTDGIADYPEEILDYIENDIEGKKKIWEQPGGKFKLECLLMCHNSQNATMELIKNKFNSISLKHFGHEDCCKLMQSVDTSKLGSVMIENFKFK